MLDILAGGQSDSVVPPWIVVIISAFLGDYDGDKGFVIWDPCIVEKFVNSDLKYSVPPPELDDCFERSNESVNDFRERIESESVTTQMRETQRFLLRSLRNPFILGRYSNYHDNSTYVYGYDHPKTILLAYK
jgi:hypothetical protein